MIQENNQGADNDIATALDGLLNGDRSYGENRDAACSSVWDFLSSRLTHVSAKEPEEIWRELNKLSGAERQKQLLSGAKTDGKAVLYGNLNAEQLEKLRVDFEKRYPLKLEVYRASGERIANRFLTEARGGQFLADVAGPATSTSPLL